MKRTEQAYFDMKPRLRTRVGLAIERARRRLWPPNATCNNDDCEYRGRRILRWKWCPACWDDGGGELIRDNRKAKTNAE